MKNLFIGLLIVTGLWLSCNAGHDHFIEGYRKSVAWLWSQQSEDGGWHSKTHNVLEDGKVLTPYILFYLLQVPHWIYQPDTKQVEDAVAFIKEQVKLHAVGYGTDTILADYPNYSAAYMLRAFELLQHRGSSRRVAKYLLDQQFIEHRGATPNSMAYGGWGYGEPNLPFGQFGHVDLSHTRRITEALLEQEIAEKELFANYRKGDLPQPMFGKSMWKEAIITFLSSVQRSPTHTRIPSQLSGSQRVPYDGGFVSSMYTVSTNKSQPVLLNDSTYYYPSYATATCDGLLALHALGMHDSDAYRDAAKWLTENQRIDVIDGLSSDDPEQWYQVMHYYHWAVRAEAMTAANIDGTWRNDLMQALVKEQQPEGFYINPIGGVNKEDDPLMATVFCVQAFTALYP